MTALRFSLLLAGTPALQSLDPRGAGLSLFTFTPPPALSRLLGCFTFTCMGSAGSLLGVTVTFWLPLFIESDATFPPKSES